MTWGPLSAAILLIVRSEITQFVGAKRDFNRTYIYKWTNFMCNSCVTQKLPSRSQQNDIHPSRSVFYMINKMVA